MTGSNEERSLYDERAASPKGLLGLAAASAAAHVSRLFHAGKSASGLTSKEIAARLGVTEGRVSQVLAGDGNVHIATVARFMQAMGYELRIDAVPVEPGRTPLNLMGRRSRRRNVEEAEKTFEVYLQTYLTHEGPVKVVSFVPGDDVLRTAPDGEPAQVARVQVSPSGRVRRTPPSQAGTWRADSVEVSKVGS